MKFLNIEGEAGLLSCINLVKAIRQGNYDYVLDLQGLLRSGLLTFFANGKIKVGVADGREFSTLFYKKIGEKSRVKEIHAIDKLTSFLNVFGINNYDHSLPLEFRNSSLSEANQNRLKQQPYILLFPESRRIEKMWPHFPDLQIAIKKKIGGQIVIAGNCPDNNFSGAVDLRGQVKLSELPQLISGAKMVVANDSAPLHIASAVNTPTVSLFGPTSDAKYGPFPKSQKTSTVIKGENNDINKIPIKYVVDSVYEIYMRN